MNSEGRIFKQNNFILLFDLLLNNYIPSRITTINRFFRLFSFSIFPLFSLSLDLGIFHVKLQIVIYFSLFLPSPFLSSETKSNEFGNSYFFHGNDNYEITMSSAKKKKRKKTQLKINKFSVIFLNHLINHRKFSKLLTNNLQRA